MKKNILLIASLFIWMINFAQTGFNYKALITDQNNALSSHTVQVRFSLLQGVTLVYQETNTAVTDANGIVSVPLGEGTVVSGDFASLDWSNNYLLKVEIDTNNGSGYQDFGTNPLRYVPQAKYAEKAGNVFGGDYNDLSNKPMIKDTVTAVIDTTTQFIRHENQNLSDVLSQNNDGGNRQIKNIAMPTDSMDVVTLSYLDKYAHGNDDFSKLVLWNKLGSDSEVLNSEVGENGELVGTGNSYEQAKFGNGYVRTDTQSYVKFPPSVLESRRTSGTIEFWVVPKVDQPSAYNYGAFMLVGWSIYGSDTFAFVRWGDGTTGLGICGGVNFDGTLHKTPDEAQQFVATVGTPFHIALVWDVNGIDDTNETIRVYRDGGVIGTSTETWDNNATTTFDHFIIGSGPDAGAHDKYIMDNIKVWNYAKTDFSDINEEGGNKGLYTAGDGIDITNNIIKLKKPKFYVGQDTLGGIVYHVYLDANGEQHGLIVSKTETTAKWQNIGVITNAIRSWDGNYNMNLMSDSPAKNWITSNFDSNWYLPSIDELSLLWQNRFYANKALNTGGYTLLSNTVYWSSTEHYTNYSYNFDFIYGTSDIVDKTNTYRVRCVRAF